MGIFLKLKRPNPVLILVLIVLLSAFLRLFQLSEHPNGMHYDEVQLGVNAYSILETARNENREFLGLHINTIGDHRPAGSAYFMIPSIFLFGLNEFAVRLPAALFGIFSILLVYFLVNLLFKNKYLALLSAFLLAISPWHINLSRNGVEATMALSFLILSAILFILGIKTERKLFFIFAYPIWILTFFSYLGAIPIILIHAFVLLVFYLIIGKKKETKIFAVVIFLVFILFPYLYFLKFQPAILAGRFNQVSIFVERGVQLRLEEQIREDGPVVHQFSTTLTRFFHNKLYNYSLAFLNNYFEYFSGRFLFSDAGLPIRFKIPDASLVYHIELPFVLLGLYWILKTRNLPGLFILFWFLVGPMAASLTVEDTPDLLRSSFTLPAWQVLAAMGGVFVLSYLKQKPLVIFSVATGIILVFQLTYFLHQFFVHQVAHRNWYRSGEWKELVGKIDPIKNNYEKIIMTKGKSEPYYYIWFYTKADPKAVQKVSPFRNTKGSWSWSKYNFIPVDCVLSEQFIENAQTKVLYVNRGECEIKEWMKELAQIKTSDGYIFFRVIEVGVDEKTLEKLKVEEKQRLLKEKTKVAL